MFGPDSREHHKIKASLIPNPVSPQFINMHIQPKRANIAKILSHMIINYSILKMCKLCLDTHTRGNQTKSTLISSDIPVKSGFLILWSEDSAQIILCRAEYKINRNPATQFEMFWMIYMMFDENFTKRGGGDDTSPLLTVKAIDLRLPNSSRCTFHC